MIRNFFKEKKEREKEREKQELNQRLLCSEQIEKLRQKMSKILGDERWYDTTYVVYSSELPNCSSSRVRLFVESACECGALSYDWHSYPDGFVCYINVQKREEPKYNVGDVVHCRVGSYRIEADVIVSGRRYDGIGRYEYLIPSETGMEWRHLDDIEKVEKETK